MILFRPAQAATESYAAEPAGTRANDLKATANLLPLPEATLAGLPSIRSSFGCPLRRAEDYGYLHFADDVASLFYGKGIKMRTKIFAFASMFAFGVFCPVAAGEGYLLVSGYWSDNVVRFDATTGQYIDEFVPRQYGGLNGAETILPGPEGSLLVASVVSNSIERYDADTGLHLGTFASGGTLKWPRGMATGPDGNLYVSSANDGILRYDGLTGDFIDEFAPISAGGPTISHGILFRGDGYLYATDINQGAIFRYDEITGAFSDVFVDGLMGPEGLAFGPDGNLYVANGGSDSILRYNGLTGAFIDTFVPPGSGGLDEPQDLFFGPDAMLYVSGWRSDNIIRYDATTGAFVDVFASHDRLDGPTDMFFVLEPEPMSLTIDIRPGNDINPVNLKSNGVLPVAILGAEGFDVALIDLESLVMAGSSPKPRGRSGNIGSFRDVNGDSIIDLVLNFDLSQLDAEPSVAELTLLGLLQDGTEFEGTDTIRIVPPGDFNGDLVVDIIDLTALASNWSTLSGGAKDWAEGDCNGDSVVDISDLTALAANWTFTDSAPPIPEPATLALLAVGGLALLRRNR